MKDLTVAFLPGWLCGNNQRQQLPSLCPYKSGLCNLSSTHFDDPFSLEKLKYTIAMQVRGHGFYFQLNPPVSPAAIHIEALQAFSSDEILFKITSFSQVQNVYK